MTGRAPASGVPSAADNRMAPRNRYPRCMLPPFVCAQLLSAQLIYAGLLCAPTMKHLFLRKARFASGHFSRGRHVLRWELRFVLGIRSGLHLVAQFQYPGLPDVTFPQLIASQSMERIQSVHLLTE